MLFLLSLRLISCDFLNGRIMLCQTKRYTFSLTNFTSNLDYSNNLLWAWYGKRRNIFYCDNHFIGNRMVVFVFFFFLGFLQSLKGLKKSFWNKVGWKYSNGMLGTIEWTKEYVILIHRWMINIPRKQTLRVSSRVATDNAHVQL